MDGILCLGPLERCRFFWRICCLDSTLNVINKFNSPIDLGLTEIYVLVSRIQVYKTVPTHSSVLLALDETQGELFKHVCITHHVSQIQSL
jgi:hypothetical protein